MNAEAKRQVIVYYSYSGNNKLLAEYLSRMTEVQALEITEIRKRNGLRIALDVFLNRVPQIHPLPISLKDFDQIIFMSPLWNGRIASPLKSLLLKCADDIRSYSFITLCGGYGKTGQLTTVEKELSSLIGKKPIWLRELDVSDLLPEEKRTKIQVVSRYHVQSDDLSRRFQDRIKEIAEDLRQSSIS